MKYYSTKTYGNERGLSCAFRQWRATSHCNQIHGYSLGFRFIFEADELDDRNRRIQRIAIEMLKDRGAIIKKISVPLMKYCLP